MAHRRQQRVAILALGVFLSASLLQAGEAKARSEPRSAPSTAAAAWESLAGAWGTMLRLWLEPWAAPAANGHRAGGGPGFGLTPTCDSGGSLNPNGGCVGGAGIGGGRHFRPKPTCDSGGSLDPNGGCHGG